MGPKRPGALLLYWRTDLLEAPPDSFDALRRTAARAREAEGVRYGLVWQGARYEGLVTVFVEHLGAFGACILDESGKDGRGAWDTLMNTNVVTGGWAAP